MDRMLKQLRRQDCSINQWLRPFAVLALCLLASWSRGQSADIPSAGAVLGLVLEKAKHEPANDRSFRSRYAFVRTRTTREIDSKGRVKKQQTKQGRNNPRIIPAAYDVPAGPPAPASARGKQQVPPKSQDQAFEKHEFQLDEELLGRFDIKVVQREQMNGRDTLVVEFKPANKKLPTRDLKDRFINKAAGKLWVDESDWFITKADLHLIDAVNVMGGLVGAVKKFNYAFDRERTEEGLWYTCSINWRLEGRELFSRKILEYEERRSEVRKVR